MTTPDLTAAVARLREQADLVGVGDIVSTVLARRTDLRLVLSALESAQQDARRYRWLRPRLYSIDFDYSDAHATVLVFEAPVHPLGPGHALDAAIDAAMGEGDA